MCMHSLLLSLTHTHRLSRWGGRNTHQDTNSPEAEVERLRFQWEHRQTIKQRLNSSLQQYLIFTETYNKIKACHIWEKNTSIWFLGYHKTSAKRICQAYHKVIISCSFTGQKNNNDVHTRPELKPYSLQVISIQNRIVQFHNYKCSLFIPVR